jgi:hypothetical protein
MTFEKMRENVRINSIHDFTVIGLLGPAGSGKDLVADWLIEKGFVKVAFADPMKRFVLRAFGIDKERLWGPSEKRNEMFDIPEAWWYEAIGHFGSAVEELIYGVLPEGKRVEGYLKLHDWLTNLRKTYTTRISARVILQTLGTEWGRSVEPLMWADYAFKVIDIIKTGNLYSQYTGLHSPRNPREVSAYSGAVIPDHRFANEIAYTKNHGGHVIRLRRLANEKSSIDIGVVGHKSEAEHKEIPDKLCDAVYELHEGIDNVHRLLEVAYAEKLWARNWDRTSEHECNVIRLDDPAVSPA